MAEAIREVVSSAILFKLADPRISGVTVLGVELTGDLRRATVAVSIMGSEAEQNLCLKGLQSAAGYLQALVAERLQTRFTPVLQFKRDAGVKKSIEMARLIDETLLADRRAHGEDVPPTAATEAASHDAGSCS
jgi:ribosome-binding factor A